MYNTQYSLYFNKGSADYNDQSSQGFVFVQQ